MGHLRFFDCYPSKGSLRTSKIWTAKKVYASHCLRKFDTPHFQEIGRVDNICTQKWQLSNKTKTGVRRTDDFFKGVCDYEKLENHCSSRIRLWPSGECKLKQKFSLQHQVLMSSQIQIITSSGF